ncbi:MAG: methylenetetrahydrofolate reductase, partial [Myxococcota bacterium]|nr:methylenetetrahydrofolate reductase [Myxococcota bacterium]
RLVCSNELRRVPPRPACDNGPSHRAYRQRYGRGDAAGLARGDRIAYVFVEGDDDATRDVGIEWATLQCRELLERGAPGIHFYTLNRSRATRAIFQHLLER